MDDTAKSSEELPVWVAALIDSNAALADAVKDLQAEQAQITALLSDIQDKVQPALDGLMSSPIIKMMKGF